MLWRDAHELRLALIVTYKQNDFGGKAGVEERAKAFCNLLYNLLLFSSSLWTGAVIFYLTAYAPTMRHIRRQNHVSATNKNRPHYHNV